MPVVPSESAIVPALHCSLITLAVAATVAVTDPHTTQW